jgi:hypothetical protein
MKVLFLDVDGVLNSRQYPDLERRGGLMGMAQVHMDELIRVINATGCKIVVSSAWRRSTVHKTLSLGSRFGEVLRAREGGEVIFRAVVGVTDDEPGIRGEQIGRWLKAHPDVTSFAIVDDDADMGDLSDRLVQTSFETGLTATEADRLIELLGKEPI